jgi:site-specific recombinase XerC
MWPSQLSSLHSAPSADNFPLWLRHRALGTSRRDAAILRLFLDTGVRVAEAAGIMLPGDLDLDDQLVIVLGKGRRPRAVPFGRTALALDRYLRMRAGHPFAHCRTSGSAGPGP